MTVFIIKILPILLPVIFSDGRDATFYVHVIALHNIMLVHVLYYVMRHCVCS